MGTLTQRVGFNRSNSALPIDDSPHYCVILQTDPFLALLEAAEIGRSRLAETRHDCELEELDYALTQAWTAFKRADQRLTLRSTRHSTDRAS